MSVRELEHAGCKIIIKHDENRQNPRTEWDNFGTMICFHRRYNLGDKDHGYSSTDFNGWDELKDEIMKREDAAVILPIFMYDHSGITISTKPFSCNWDSGQIGFIFVSKYDARCEYSCKRLHKNTLEKIRAALEGEVKTYNDYLTGSVYFYLVETEDGEIVGSCGGFYGYDETKDDSEMIKQAKAEAEAYEHPEVIDKDQLVLEIGV